MNYEHDKKEQRSQDETGYSEKQLDIDVEIRAGEWQNLRRFRTYQRRSRQWKIIATHRAISYRIIQLEEFFYGLVRNNPSKGQKMLLELKKLRYMQEILLQCMIWEPKGQLEKDMVPSDVWELIK